MRNEPRTFWPAVRLRALALLISVIGTFALAQQLPSGPRKSAPGPAATEQPPSSGQPAATEPPPSPGQPATAEPPPNAGPMAEQEQTGSDSPAGADKADTDETAPPASAPDKPAAARGSPQHFEPTEKVRPDFDVAFPVDI